MVKKLVALGVALALLALLEPAVAGVKFTDEDLKSEESLWRLYERWGARYNVTRHPVDKLRRFAFFKDSARHVHLHATAAGQAPGLNGFADLTNDEFNRYYKCNMLEAGARRTLPVRRRGDGSLPLPISIDWRIKSCGTGPCLSPVKSQGVCGSCWAFTATGAMESHYTIQGAKDNRGLVDLSEQELVDCDTHSIGCKGGEVDYAFDYIIAKQGLASLASYPYTATNGTCQAAGKPRVDLLLRVYETVPANDEFQMLQAVTYGPVGVSIAVGPNNLEFRYYDGGIYSGPCGVANDHAILLVGYESNLYVLKNSYGERWGDDGYMYLKRDHGK
ncbi:ervatamin-C, partial [Setaria italica]|uniref:Peptidase C1A papain C-terminal domain-containing protein n=1 Tax=Setaria italica TaxID=4555 RepID=K3Z287_SETIT